MRKRSLGLILVLALVAAACVGGEAGTSTTSTTQGPASTTTEATATGPEAVLLSYSLSPGLTLEYQVDLDISIDMTSSGNAAALSEGEELPGEASMRLSGTTSFVYSVADGPEPGTFEVTITGDFSNLEITGTIDGEPIDPAELPDFAEIPGVDGTVVVDEQGNVISGEGAFGDLFGGDLGGLGDFGGPGTDLGRFIGPPFGDGEVTVGNSWSKTIERQLFLADPITTEIRSVVTGFDTDDCEGAYLIETTSMTSEINIDLAELLVGFLGAFVPEGASEEERAEIEALKDQLRFLFVIDEATTSIDTCFDAAAGLVQSADYRGDTHFVMDINMADETTGEMVEFAMDMSFSQVVSYRLVSASGA